MSLRLEESEHPWYERYEKLEKKEYNKKAFIYKNPSTFLYTNPSLVMKKQQTNYEMYIILLILILLLIFRRH